MAKKTSDMNCRWVPAVPGVGALSCLRHSLLNTCGTRCCTLQNRREARYRTAEKHAARPQRNTLQDRKRRRRGYIYFAYPESAKPLGTFSRDQVGKYRRHVRSSRPSPADGVRNAGMDVRTVCIFIDVVSRLCWASKVSVVLTVA